MVELGIAGTAVGIISVGIQVCQGMLSYYESWKSCHKDIENTSRSIKSLVETLGHLSKAFENQRVGCKAVDPQKDKILGQCTVGI